MIRTLLVGFAGGVLGGLLVFGVIVGVSSRKGVTFISAQSRGAAGIPTPSRNQLEQVLLRNIAEYERIYARYAPRNSNDGDYRPLQLAIEPFAAQRPEFAAYFAWRRKKYDYGRSLFALFAIYLPAQMGEDRPQYVGTK